METLRQSEEARWVQARSRSIRRLIRLITASRSQTAFIIIGGLYLIAACWLFSDYRYGLNPDGVSYLAIAGSYLHGHFGAAINAYWGPLFSWLLVPFLSLHYNPIASAHALIVIIGLFSLWAVWRLLRQLRLPEWAEISLVATSALLILFWVVTGPITPDLLLVGLLALYLQAVWRFAAAPSLPRAMVCGLIGALLYLTKSYGLAFFIVHFTIVAALVVWARPQPDRRRVIRLWLWGLATTLVIALPWIIAISFKQHTLTTGTASSYNFKLSAPAVGQHQPMLTAGLLPPPNQWAISAWDDPSDLKLPSWQLSVWPHPHNLHYLANLISNNFKTLWSDLGSASALSLAAFLGIFAVAFSRRPNTSRRAALSILAAILIYPAGYLLFTIEDRYIWFVYLLLLVGGSLALWQAYQTQVLDRLQAAGLQAVLILTFIWNPLGQLNTVATTSHAGGNPLSALSYQIGQRANLNGAHVASTNNWGYSLYLSYYTGASYYGLLQARHDPAGELTQYDIKYVLQWGYTAKLPTYLHNYHLVSGNANSQVIVYQRN